MVGERNISQVILSNAVVCVLKPSCTFEQWFQNVLVFFFFRLSPSTFPASLQNFSWFSFDVSCHSLFRHCLTCFFPTHFGNHCLYVCLTLWLLHKQYISMHCKQSTFDRLTNVTVGWMLQRAVNRIWGCLKCSEARNLDFELSTHFHIPALHVSVGHLKFNLLQTFYAPFFM